MMTSTLIQSNKASIESQSIKTDILSGLFSCMIPIIPLVIYYFFPFTTISLDTALIFAISLYVIICAFFKRSKISFKSCKYYFLLLICTIVITTYYYILNYYSVNYGIGFWYILLVFCVIFGVDNNILDKRLIIKTYRIISYIGLLLLIVQWLVFLISGYRISFMFFVFKFNDGYAGLNVKFITNSPVSSNFAAFFSERSHFCLFIMPFLCMSISRFFLNRKKFIAPFITTAMIISTTSGNGIIVCAVSWIVSVLFITKGKRRIIVFLVVITTVVLSYFILKQIPEFDSIFSTLFRSKNEFSHSKADYRIYRGFDSYFQLPLFNKFFGIGYRCLDSSFNYYGLIDHYNTTGEYMGCLSQILVYSGIFGMLFFSLFMFVLFRKGGSLSRTILICFIFFCISSSIYFDSIWILYLSLVISLLEYELDIKKGLEYGII